MPTHVHQVPGRWVALQFGALSRLATNVSVLLHGLGRTACAVRPRHVRGPRAGLEKPHRLAGGPHCGVLEPARNVPPRARVAHRCALRAPHDHPAQACHVQRVAQVRPFSSPVGHHRARPPPVCVQRWLPWCRYFSRLLINFFVSLLVSLFLSFFAYRLASLGRAGLFPGFRRAAV